MARRAYSPRRTTVDLIARILRLDGIRTVHTIAPSHGPSPRPTMLRVILTESDGAGQPIRTDFTLAEAREWLAHEEAAR